MTPMEMSQSAALCLMELPPALQMQALERLSMVRCTGLPPLAGLSALQSLDLSGSSVTAGYMSDLSELPRLTRLVMRLCLLPGLSLMLPTRLRSLSMRDCCMSYEALAARLP